MNLLVKDTLNRLPRFPFVSVIIPVYNDTPRLIKLLESLEKQSYPRDSYEIIVVDNGSQGDVAHLARRFNIRLGYETGTRGSYAARNKGIEMAGGEILCFTDSDCVVSEDWLIGGIKTLMEQGAHMVGGNVVFTFSSQKRAAEYYDAITNMQIETIVKERGVAITANLFMDRRVVDKTGLFPHHLKSGGDIFYTARAVGKGLKLVYSPGAYVYHPTRGFRQLLKKSIRVGNGKSGMHKLREDDEVPPEVLQSRNPLSHLNPVATWKRLKKMGYRVGGIKFLSILLVSYCYLFTMFFSRLLGNIND
ncbi:MAG: glycosyltransferase [bacterium]|nr:glycosyltransferase [bacterium]